MRYGSIIPCFAKKGLPVAFSALVLLTWVVGCLGRGRGDDGPKESDVPCFMSEAWTSVGALRVRAENANGSGVILFTQQTIAQIQLDNADIQSDFSPHDPVYRFDPLTEEIVLTAERDWDAALGDVADANGSASDSPFTTGGGTGRRSLLFNGETVPVQGGTVVKIYQAPGAEVVAVVSATGTPSLPLFTNGQTSGQHFHQLFSEVTGEPIGPALRIGVGGQDVGPVNGRWVANNRYVVHETHNGTTFDLICIVDVQDVLNGTVKSNPD